MDYQEAGNNYDMLKGCVNRIFVTDDKDELVSLYAGALHYLSPLQSSPCLCLSITEADLKGQCLFCGVLQVFSA